LSIVRRNPPKTNSSRLTTTSLVVLLLFILLPSTTHARKTPAAHFSTFAAGEGPEEVDGGYRLLDGHDTPGQSNAVAFDVAQEGAFEKMSMRCRFRVLAGGDGGSFLFLNTTEFGRRGPAPFVKNWAEPNLASTFAVGIDVHDPPNDDPMGPWGNYQRLPEREVSLHWDGREIVKRVAPAEFRGNFTECEITVKDVIGGAEVTVRIAGEAVFDNYFLPGMHPYESRLAIGAGTRNDATTKFDVTDMVFSKLNPVGPRRLPTHVEVFNHVLTDGLVPSCEKEVMLPPPGWAYGRVILTLQIHDAGPDWDKWDRIGYLSVVGPDGEKFDIVPFITSFRTPCVWRVDVTPFRPLLAGRVRFEIATGTPNDEKHNFMMSVSLDFYHGTPDLEPFRVVPLWVGTARYQSGANHFSDFFTPQTVGIDPGTKAARLFITTTGHSTIGEFTPSRRTLVFAPEKGGGPAAEQRFVNVLWKTDGYLNPNRPQFGTWKFSRAGWAPGDVVRPWWIDLTPYVVPGTTAELRYLPEPYDFSDLPADQRPTDDEINQAVQVVRAYLIFYRSPADLMPAPPFRVLEVLAGSNASKIDIREGDYLESYDGQRPVSIADLRRLILEAEGAGMERVDIVIFRGTERMELEIGTGRMGLNLEEQ